MSKDTIGTVVLGFGPQELDWIGKAAKVAGKGAVVDPDVARMAGANLAVGGREALDLLKERLRAGAIEAVSQANCTLSPQATKWLATGERGESSNAIFTNVLSHDASGDGGEPKAHPYDPDDLRRCMLLLEQVPEVADGFAKMAAVSPKWAQLVRAWPMLVLSINAESPSWRIGLGEAPKTAKLIREALGRA